MALTQVSRGLLSTSIVDNGNATAITIDSSENVGIGTTSPDEALEVSGDLKISGSNFGIVQFGETSDQTKIVGRDSSHASLPNTMEFFTNSVNRMVINSSGNVGIGTSSPASELDVAGTTPTLTIKDTQNKSWTSSDTTLGELAFRISDTSGIGEHNVAFVRAVNDITSSSTPSGALSFGVSGANTNASEAMRIDSSGNVIVGGTSASQAGSVTLEGDGDVRGILSSGAGGDTVLSAISGVSNGYQISVTTGNAQTYKWHNGGTQSMTLDSSGNLLVGTTTNSSSVAGVTAGNSGLITACRSSNYSAIFNRLSTNGAIADFRKNGSTIGSIGVAATSDYFAVGNNNTSIQFYAGGIVPATGSVSTFSDNAKDLGSLQVRWDDVYATNGTIQTSDRNEKQDIEALSDAEQRVAVAAKSLLRKFRWISSVEAKGDDARIHFGIIAQDLQDAFTAEGLDAGRYAMFISSTWTDDDGNEQTRLGVRYSELLAFIISAI